MYCSRSNFINKRTFYNNAINQQRFKQADSLQLLGDISHSILLLLFRHTILAMQEVNIGREDAVKTVQMYKKPIPTQNVVILTFVMELDTIFSFLQCSLSVLSSP